MERRTWVRRAGAKGWARRLKRVFAIDIEKCERCGHLARAGPEAQQLFD
jgi:hypothetical protein